MTTATIDPIGVLVAESRTGDVRGYDHPVHGIWGHGYSYCHERNPEHDHVCTRVSGHDPSWPHVAATSGRVLSMWGGVPPEPPKSSLGIELGQTLDTIPKYNDPVNGVLVAPENWCSYQIDHRYICTRAVGHSEDHVGCSPQRVVAIVAAAGIDPFAHVNSGYASDYPGYNHGVHGLYTDSGRCGATNPGSNNTCKRPSGHPGKHIGTNGNGRMVWFGALNSLFLTIPDFELQDPLDGTIADTDTITAQPEVGSVVRLKDRSNLLYVMGQRNSLVEALDMSRWQIRTLPLSLLVATDNVISTDDLRQVVRWYSGHRDQVRKVAVREYRNDRWCMDGLNRNLSSLGLEKYVPSLRGQVQIGLPFEIDDIHATQSDIEAKILAAMSSPVVVAALRVAIPAIDGLDLHPEDLTVTSTNYVRK